MNQTWKNSAEPIFGHNFGRNLGPNFLLWVLPLLDVTHCCKLSLYAIQTKPVNQTWENSEEPKFGPSFGPNLRLPPLIFFQNFTSTRCWNLLQAIIQAIIVCNLKEI